jgi:hypothetical protein
MAVTVKITVFWDVTLYSLVEVYQHFRGKYCLHLQGQRAKAESLCLLVGFLFNVMMEALLSAIMSVTTRLHSAISQKTVLFTCYIFLALLHQV